MGWSCPIVYFCPVLIDFLKMRVIFLSNFLTHHQKPLSDELYALLGNGNYFFVCTKEVSEERKRLGWPVLEAPYALQYNDDNRREIEKMIETADAVIYGDAPLALVKKRYEEGKLTLCNSERRYKTISRYLKYPINSYKSYYINKGYLLASSAFAPRDYMISGMPLKKCFKWGYFPEVKTYSDIDVIINKKGYGKEKHHALSLLWAGRLIRYKHPEMPLHIASKLRKEGYTFHLDMIGNGEMEAGLRSKIEEYHLSDCVSLFGSMTPSEVRAHMEQADIFLFTSDRQEGWGAVLNESMNSACAVVVSDAIGSTPYLIKDGGNGMKYQCGNVEDLYQKVKYLIDQPTARFKMQRNAYETIHEIWNSKNAASCLIRLCDALLNGNSTPIAEGPGSRASLIFDKWII